tara:strand:- start:11156 stop:12352 length:1197 start_codon:yes stop_codon:yes gene_type:complete
MKFLKATLLSITILLISSCKTSKKKPKRIDEEFKELTFSAEAAPEWTALMERTHGWFGADGIYSIPLDGIEQKEVKDKKTLFIFSDTYIGVVENGVPKLGNIMVNNSTAWMIGNEPERSKIDFEFNLDESGKPTTYFVPDNSYKKIKEYFWLGDGFINHKKNNSLYIFAYHVHKTGPNVFDFQQTNISLLKIKDPSKEGIKKYKKISTELGFTHEVEQKRVFFGSGIFVNTKEANAPDPDGFVYIYGLIEGEKSLVVARTKPNDIEMFESYRFWNGAGWVKNKHEVASLANGVSNELSVTPTEDGRFLLTYQILGISDKVGIQVGLSPVGPFGKVHQVYTTPEYAEKNLLPYNAKAHYHLSKPGELLISYNTITHNFWEDIQKDATIYHPRFIRVKYE